MAFSKSWLRGVLSDFFSFLYNKYPSKVSLVIPAYNEERTLGSIIKQAKLVKAINEIIVVDDGSRDDTAKISKDLGVGVIKHHKNLGKGEAIKTGISHAKGDIILFLDADLKNITSDKISALIKPLLNNKADFTKAGFTRVRGRVTEFAVKPMMKVLYPELRFKQPISGQFAGRKAFLEKIKIEPRWGIDIAILLDAIKKGQRIVEVNIGELIHKKSSDDEVAKMSGEVMETMLKKAGLLYDKHKIIFFSDRVFFKNSEVSQLFLQNLMNKKIKTVLITTKNISPDFAKYFNLVKKIDSLKDPKEILNLAKRICRRFKVNLDECILIANKIGFQELAKKVNYAFCFESSPYSLKDKCKIISNPVEILVFLE